METTIQQPYRDESPISSPSSSPVSDSGRASTRKPLPSPPNDSPIFEEAYRDEPSQAYRDEHSPSYTHTSIAAPRSSCYRGGSEIFSRQAQAHLTPYTDTPSAHSEDDVALAHLYPYPTEAPPAYHVVVRQSYRDTVVAHIPTNFTGWPENTDEEAARDIEEADEARFTVERVIAGLIVSMILVLIAALMVWHILSFYFDTSL